MTRMAGNGVTYGNYFFIDWQTNSQSTPGNYSNISWWAYWHFQGSDHQLDNGYANLGDATRWSNGGRIYNYAGNFTTRDMLLASGSFDIGHNSDGTKTLNVAGGATGYQVGRSEGSGSWGLPTIPRYPTITGHSGTINDEATNVYISYSNPYGGAVSADLYVRPYGSTGGFTNFAHRNSYGSGVNFSLTTAEMNAARAALASTNQGQLLYRVTNGVGNTDYGWGNEVQLNIINAAPTFAASQISYLDTNAATVAITADNQKIIQNQSTLQAAFTAAIALKSATITKYDVTLDTDVRTFTTAQTAIAYGIRNLSADTPLSIKVTDSRGNTVTVSKTVTVLPWSLPSAVVSIKRVNNYEDSTKVKADVTIAPVAGQNSIQVLKVRRKKTTDSTWTETNLTSGTEATLTMDKLFEWNVEIVITDKLGTTTYTALLSKGIPIMFLDNVKLSVGIGMFPAGTGTFEVADSYLVPLMKKVHPVGRIIMSTSSTNPGTLPELNGTTWTAWGTGRVPVGIDTGQTEFNTIEKTGGHKLLQSHVHNISPDSGSGGSPYNGRTVGPAAGGNYNTSAAGGGDSQNLQPYITCYFWKRTA